MRGTSRKYIWGIYTFVKEELLWQLSKVEDNKYNETQLEVDQLISYYRILSFG